MYAHYPFEECSEALEKLVIVKIVKVSEVVKIRWKILIQVHKVHKVNTDGYTGR